MQTFDVLCGKEGCRVLESMKSLDRFEYTSLCRDEGTEATQLSFLENHLGIWIDDFADRVRRADASGAYAAAATVAADFVRCDKKFIAKLIT